MLRFLHIHKLGVSIVNAVFIALLLVVFSQSFHTCMAANTYADAQHSTREGLGEIIGAWWWCSGLFVDQNGTAITALATIAMAAFTGTLWWSTAGTAKLTARTVDLAEKQFLMEGRQADLAEKQHALQRLQYYATHRPRVRVRSVSGPIRKGSADIFRVVVANAGESTAYITSYGIQAFDHDGEAASEILLNPVAPFDDAKLASGDGYIFDTELREAWTEDIDDPSRDGPVFVTGIISYRDETEIVRHTAFAREVIGGGNFDFAKVYAEQEYED